MQGLPLQVGGLLQGFALSSPVQQQPAQQQQPQQQNLVPPTNLVAPPGVPEISPCLPSVLAPPAEVTSTQQGTPNSTSNAEAVLKQLFKPKFTDVTIEQLRKTQQMFAAERDWDQYHTPRNLVLALTGELGELAELFQWRGEVKRDLPGFSAQEKVHVGEELSDILLYLVRLADVCGIDLGAAVLDKLQKNAAKYPAEKCRGSSTKYNQLAPPILPIKKERAAAKSPSLTPPQLGDGTMPPMSSDEMKRKRFNDAQVEALTALADAYSWSLSSVPAEERDKICMEHNISKERLQNFFNNRKPKEMKKPRPKSYMQDQDEMHAAEQLQHLQQGQGLSAATPEAVLHADHDHTAGVMQG